MDDRKDRTSVKKTIEPDRAVGAVLDPLCGVVERDDMDLEVVGDRALDQGEKAAELLGAELEPDDGGLLPAVKSNLAKSISTHERRF